MFQLNNTVKSVFNRNNNTHKQTNTEKNELNYFHIFLIKSAENTHSGQTLNFISWICQNEIYLIVDPHTRRRELTSLFMYALQEVRIKTMLGKLYHFKRLARLNYEYSAANCWHLLGTNYIIFFLNTQTQYTWTTSKNGWKLFFYFSNYATVCIAYFNRHHLLRATQNRSPIHSNELMQKNGNEQRRSPLTVI